MSNLYAVGQAFTWLTLAVLFYGLWLYTQDTSSSFRSGFVNQWHVLLGSLQKLWIVLFIGLAIGLFFSMFPSMLASTSALMCVQNASAAAPEMLAPGSTVVVDNPHKVTRDALPSESIASNPADCTMLWQRMNVAGP